MACAFSLFCWHWTSLCWLGSKQLNIYYVTSSNGVKLCDFKRCSLVGFLWSCLKIFQAVFGISRRMHICSILIFSSQKQTKEDCSSLCLIDKSSLCNSFIYQVFAIRSMYIQYYIDSSTVMFHVSHFRPWRLSQVDPWPRFWMMYSHWRWCCA